MFVQNFRPSDTSIVHPQAREFVQRFLVDLKQSPQDFLELIKGYVLVTICCWKANQKNLRRTAGGLAISLAYGIPVKPHDDPYIELSENMGETLREMGRPGSNFVDLFPVLKYLPAWTPGAWYKRRAKELADMVEQSHSAPFDKALSTLVRSSASIAFMSCPPMVICIQGSEGTRPSFVSTASSSLEESSDPEKAARQRQVIKDTAAMFYNAGTDSIGGSIATWIWAMMKNPDVQAKLHAELDEVLKGRMPDFEDQERLPYLMATLMEAARCVAVSCYQAGYTDLCQLGPCYATRSVLPAQPIVMLDFPAEISTLGAPHLNTEDDVYEEYAIPKGSIVVANIW